MPSPNNREITDLSKQVSNRSLSMKEREAALQKLTTLLNSVYKDSEDRLNANLNNFDQQWKEFTGRNKQFFDAPSLSPEDEGEAAELFAKVQDQVRLEGLEKQLRGQGTPIPPKQIDDDDEEAQVNEIMSQVMDEIRLEELAKQSKTTVTPPSEDDELAQLEAELEEEFDNSPQEVSLDELIQQSHDLIKESESVGLIDEEELERELAAMSDEELEAEMGEEYEKLNQEIAKEEAITTPLVQESSKKDKLSEATSKIKGQDSALSPSHPSTEKKGFLGFLQSMIQSIKKGFDAIFGGNKPKSSPVIPVEKAPASPKTAPTKITIEPTKSEKITTSKQKNETRIKDYRNPGQSKLEHAQAKREKLVEAHQKAQKACKNIIEIKEQYKEKMAALREERDKHIREHKERRQGPRQ